MHECWFENTLARLSALRIKKNLTETQVTMNMIMRTIKKRLDVKVEIKKEFFRRRIAGLATSDEIVQTIFNEASKDLKEPNEASKAGSFREKKIPMSVLPGPGSLLDGF